MRAHDAAPRLAGRERGDIHGGMSRPDGRGAGEYSALPAALALAEEHGLAVFPARADKSPHTAHGLHDATRGIEQIAEWWDRWPDALVAVPTGRASGLLVVDIDPAGAEWYREHADRLGAGRIHRTRRGHHLLYRMPDIAVRNSASRIAPGVDVRGDGGYVIWWPAHGYEAVGEIEDLTPPPEWLLALMREPVRETRSDETAEGMIGAGSRNEYLSREAYRMRRQGATVEQITAALAALNRARCAPPLDDGEIAAIARGKTRIEPEPTAEPQFTRRPIDWRSLIGQTPPERDWAVSHWLGMGYVTLLAGAGGTGKTLLAQTLATCLALGRGYIDYAPRPRRVLMLAGEDDEAELWRRQVAICRWLGVGLDAVADALIIESYVDRDMTLADIAHGQLTRTPFLAELREQIGDYQAEIVVLDSVARVFGGSENDRHHVTQFLTWLAAACEPTRAGLLLLAHPSRAAGSEWSGSTAWEASVRARLYLGRTLPDQEPDEDAPPDETVRYLARRKANYTDRDYRRLTYRDGVLVPELDEQRQPVRRPTGDAAIDVVVRAVRQLNAIGVHPCASRSSPRYLPRLAAQYEYTEGMSPRDIEHAMRAAQKSGRLVTAVVGRAANRTPVMGLAEPASGEVH